MVPVHRTAPAVVVAVRDASLGCPRIAVWLEIKEMFWLDSVLVSDIFFTKILLLCNIAYVPRHLLLFQNFKKADSSKQ